MAGPSGTTPVLGLPYPLDPDTVDVSRDMAALANALDRASFVFSGTAVARPSASTVPDGAVYYATDTQSLTITFGDSWFNVLPPDGSITLAKLAANSVDATKIVDGSVGTNELAADSVTAAKIAAGAVGASEIADGTVGNAELAAGAVNSAKIADGTVAQADLAFKAVEAINTPTLTKFSLVSGGSIVAGGSLLVPHSLGATAKYAIVQQYAVGLPTTFTVEALNYDIPNSTQIRVYNPSSGTIAGCTVMAFT